MPLWSLNPSPVSVPLYAVPNKDGDKIYLCSKNHYRDAKGNIIRDDLECRFKAESPDSDRFQIVREKDGWLASDHSGYVTFHVCISTFLERFALI